MRSPSRATMTGLTNAKKPWLCDPNLRWPDVSTTVTRHHFADLRGRHAHAALSGAHGVFQVARQFAERAVEARDQRTRRRQTRVGNVDDRAKH